MSRRLSLVPTCLVSSTVLACLSWFVPPTSAQENRGSTMFYDDRASFTAAFPGLPLEDFAATSAAMGSVRNCPGPLDSTSDDDCFASGSVISGFSMDAFNAAGNSDLYAIANDVVSLAPCPAVGPFNFSPDTRWSFSPPVVAAAFDLYGYNNNLSYTIEVFSPDGSIATLPVTTPGGDTPFFFGVSTDDFEGISSIEVVGTLSLSTELFCDLEFGGLPPSAIFVDGFESGNTSAWNSTRSRR